MNKLFATVIMSAGLAAAAPYALAQAVAAAPGAEAPQARPGPRAEGMPHHGMHRAHLKPTERVEARLAYIRTALKITPAQQPQWDAFADVVRKQAQQTEQFMASRRAEGTQGAQAPRQRLTAIDRLERRQKFMAVASQRLDEVIAAAKPLYAALNPEQQQVADDLLARQARGRMGHRGFHHGA